MRAKDLAVDPGTHSKLIQIAPMEILILGGAGMLGHKLFQRLKQSHPDTCCTIRGLVHDDPLKDVEVFHTGQVIENCDVRDWPALQRLLSRLRPKIVVNCVGVVKQRPEAKQPIPSIEINALLPHKLASICKSWGGRLIHFSTDCVFSGQRGNYTEDDESDAQDLYGRSKFLGEVTAKGAITIRTSIIGREFEHRESLLEWFLRQDHKCVSGYTRAMFSGVTTNYLARVVDKLIVDFPQLTGLYQVTGPTISKFELLGLLREAYQLDIEIVPDEEFSCDRSMKGDKFEQATGYVTPGWSTLVAELASDDTSYEKRQ
jgi:dTDP-4-dehydrorhamnose reductase